MSTKARHYRVVKKQVEHDNNTYAGIYVPKQKQHIIIVALIMYSLLIFLKGIFFGFFFSKHS